MRKVIDALAAGLIALAIWCAHARAQEPVYPGTYTAGANGNGLAFAPYSSSNPLPVTLEGSGGTSNVNVLQWDTTALGAPTAWGSGSPSGNVISTNTAVLDWAGGTLGAMANYGSSPGMVLVPGVNAFVTNTPSVTLPTTPTIAAGNGVVPAPSSEAGAGLSTAECSSLCANQVIKNAAGNLYSFNVSADSTLSGAAWWLMIYNATSAPSDGSVTPIKCYAFPSGTTSYSAAFPVPIAFSTGITAGVSTTGCFTKTASTHAFISGDYK